MRNGQPQSIEELVAALGGGQKPPQSPEEALANAKRDMERTLDMALNGTCPGNENPRHRAVAESFVTLLNAMGNRGLLAEPVEDSMVKVIAHLAMHSEQGLPEALAAYMKPDIQHLVILCVAAALRVSHEPDTTGVAQGRNGHGQYL